MKHLRPDMSGDFAVGIQTGEEDHQAPIQMCPLHHEALCDTMVRAGMSPEVSMDSTSLRAFQTIVRMATKLLGTVEVVKFQCPVCAMQQFDYITNVVEALKPRGTVNG